MSSKTLSERVEKMVSKVDNLATELSVIEPAELCKSYLQNQYIDEFTLKLLEELTDMANDLRDKLDALAIISRV